MEGMVSWIDRLHLKEYCRATPVDQLSGPFSARLSSKFFMKKDLE
jgi:hypothetical protein